MIRLLFILALSAVIVSARPLPAQMALAHETASSAAQTAYLDTLTAVLQEVDFSSGLGIIRVERGEVEAFLENENATFGVVYLDNQLTEGRSASALLATPGAFGSLGDLHTAQRGVLGDVVREEIEGDDRFALSLWTHVNRHPMLAPYRRARLTPLVLSWPGAA